MIHTTWKSKLLKFTGSALLGISVIAMPMQAGAEVSGTSGPSVATTGPHAAAGTNIQLAQWGPPPPGPGWGRPPPPPGGWYRPPPPPPPGGWRRPPPPRYGAPPPRYHRSDAHVRWCLNRYRSYNPRTDQYLGYDGYYHYCRSPYR
ncbi:BA14K family protein [uncultured Roseibium sp.]|uniref:BA14K family protein n=1 Tax=uncultured Roseibium sp. TaxID=1936171 RepID=UPI0032171F6B